MLLFNIPDIRLFWSKDQRFLQQFKKDTISSFKPYSKYPACMKDISFWVSDSFVENDFYDIIREVAGDLVEKVEFFDTFFSEKKNKKSNAFRIYYRSFDQTLTNQEIDVLQFKIRNKLMQFPGIELR